MQIIGLSGYARSGKDEAAKVLVEEFGFVRVAFADKLREFLYALNPIVWKGRTYDGGNHPTGWKSIHVQDAIDKFGWDNYKESEYGPEIRRLLQRLGTEAGRQTLWDSIWIDAAFANLPEDAKVVVTDARFPNEAQAIKARRGKVWRVTREGIGPAVGADGSIHPSETSLDDWQFDYMLWNNSTLEKYHTDIRSVMAMYAHDSQDWEKALNASRI